jgi:ferritin
MLQWFIKEQVEEEKNATEIIELMKLAGASGPALLMLDRQLGARARG